MKKIVYKITYPNGKIYVGKDLTNTFTYFGSVNDDLVKKDFTEDQMKVFTITKEVLFESSDTMEVNQAEVKWILELESNNPGVGYNLWPKFKE